MGKKESLLCLSLFSDDGGRFLRFNTIQGALNGKEKKKAAKRKAAPKKKRAAPKKKKAAPKKKRAAPKKKKKAAKKRRR